MMSAVGLKASKTSKIVSSFDIKDFYPTITK